MKIKIVKRKNSWNLTRSNVEPLNIHRTEQIFMDMHSVYIHAKVAAGWKWAIPCQYTLPARLYLVFIFFLLVLFCLVCSWVYLFSIFNIAHSYSYSTHLVCHCCGCCCSATLVYTMNEGDSSRVHRTAHIYTTIQRTIFSCTKLVSCHTESVARATANASTLACNVCMHNHNHETANVRVVQWFGDCQFAVVACERQWRQHLPMCVIDFIPFRLNRVSHGVCTGDADNYIRFVCAPDCQSNSIIILFAKFFSFGLFSFKFTH